jgi:hypothetical protein
MEDDDDGRQLDERTPLDEPAPTLHFLRQQCEALASDPKLDKDAALGVLRLMHGMETMLLTRTFEKDREVQTLQSELALLRQQIHRTELLETLTTDVANLKSIVAQLTADAASRKDPRKR